MSEDKGSLEEALGVSSADAAIDFNAGAATAEELTLIAELKEDLKVYFSLLLLIKKPFRERERESTLDANTNTVVEASRLLTANLGCANLPPLCQKRARFSYPVMGARVQGCQKGPQSCKTCHPS